MKTMNDSYPLLCRDCRWSSPENAYGSSLRCMNPIINSRDPWALSSTNLAGTSCKDERAKRSLLAKCGMKGKLWETKNA